MRRYSVLLLLLLTLLFTTGFVRAEDVNEQDAGNEEEGDGEAEENVDENEDADAGDGEAEADADGEADGEADVEAEEEDVNVYDGNNGNYYTNQIKVCADAVVQVQNISLACDSPGAYYYGSGKYRNSQTCKAGDKARLQIDFYIAEQQAIQQASKYVLVDVDVSDSGGGWWSQSRSVYENADLCSLSSLKSSSGTQCPYNGYYQIKTQFYWSDDDSNKEDLGVPVVTVGFKSDLDVNGYDFGGANTNQCKGSMESIGTNVIKTTYADAVSTFMKTFGLLLVAILGISVFIWFLAKRPKSLTEVRVHLIGRRQTHRDMSIHNADEEFDFRKIQTGREQDLVDF